MESLSTNTISPKLVELEGIIERGRKTFLDVGQALAEIRDGRLYKEKGFKTFEEYLDKRDISRAHGYRLMAAAKEAALSPIGDKPANEYQARKRNQLSEPRESTKKLAIPILEKPATSIPENLTVQGEYLKFQALVETWEAEFSWDDYASLIEKVLTYLDEGDRKKGDWYPTEREEEEEEVAA